MACSYLYSVPLRFQLTLSNLIFRPIFIISYRFISVILWGKEKTLSLSELLNKVHISSTANFAQKAKDLQARGENIIDLTVGESDFMTPPDVKTAAKNAIDENKTRYTANAGMNELRSAIADKLKRDNRLDYSTNNIIVSSGAKQSIFNAIFSLVYTDEEVIIPAPYWVSYPEIVRIAHGIPVIIPADEKSGFKITPAQLENSITSKTKALILCNPSNPTGAVYSRKELAALAKVIENKKIYVISDEIYEKLVYDNFEFTSFASLNKKMKEKTITVNGVSKAYAMTGWRIGYAAGPENVIAAMNTIQSHSTSNASSISQTAAIEALSGDQSPLAAMRTEYEKRRNFLHKELTSIKGITCRKPEGAFYLFPDVSGFFGKRNISDSTDFVLYLLENAKVATVPGRPFGADNNIRLSYATSMKNLEEAAGRLKETLERLK